MTYLRLAVLLKLLWGVGKLQETDSWEVLMDYPVDYSVGRWERLLRHPLVPSVIFLNGK